MIFKFVQPAIKKCFIFNLWKYPLIWVMDAQRKLTMYSVHHNVPWVSSAWSIYRFSIPNPLNFQDIQSGHVFLEQSSINKSGARSKARQKRWRAINLWLATYLNNESESDAVLCFTPHKEHHHNTILYRPECCKLQSKQKAKQSNTCTF